MKPRYALFLTGLILAVVAIVSGTLNIISLWWLRGETIRTSYASSPVLVVAADCGSVTVRGDDVDRTTVSTHVVWSFREPTVESSLAGDTRTIRAHCGWSFGNGNSADVTVTVPRSTDVSVNSSDSGIHLEGLSGKVEAVSSGGSVEGTSLAALSATAHSSEGAVLLEFALAPARVQASSSSGSVEVRLPRGPASYRVTASSPDGSTTTRIRTDPDSDRSISATSSDGDVRIIYSN